MSKTVLFVGALRCPGSYKLMLKNRDELIGKKLTVIGYADSIPIMAEVRSGQHGRDLLVYILPVITSFLNCTATSVRYANLKSYGRTTNIDSRQRKLL